MATKDAIKYVGTPLNFLYKGLKAGVNAGTSLFYHVERASEAAGSGVLTEVRDKGRIAVDEESSEIKHFGWPAIKKAGNTVYIDAKTKVGNFVDAAAETTYRNRFGVFYGILPAPRRYEAWIKDRKSTEAVHNSSYKLSSELQNELYKRDNLARITIGKRQKDTNSAIDNNFEKCRDSAKRTQTALGRTFDARHKYIPARMEPELIKLGDRLSQDNIAHEKTYDNSVNSILRYVKGSGTPVKGSLRAITRTTAKKGLKFGNKIEKEYERERKIAISGHVKDLDNLARKGIIEGKVAYFGAKLEEMKESVKGVTELERQYWNGAYRHTADLDNAFRPIKSITDVIVGETVNSQLEEILSNKASVAAKK